MKKKKTVKKNQNTMGNYQSTAMKVSIDALTKTMINITNNIMTEARQDCSQLQHIKVIISGDVGGSVTLNQSQQIACNFTSALLADLEADISNDIKKSIDTQISAFNESVQGLFNTNISSQNQTITLRQFIENSFTSNIQRDIKAKCSQNLYALQNAEIEVTGRIKNNLIVTQNSQAVVIGDCIFKIATKNILDNKEATDLLTDIDQKQSSHQKGFEALFDFWWVFLLIGLVILFFYIYYKHYKQSKKKEAGKRKRPEKEIY